MFILLLLVTTVLFVHNSMSFTLLNPSTMRARSLFKFSSSVASTQLRSNIFRHFSSVREEILFKDGRKGWIHDRKAGWFTVAIPSGNGSEQVGTFYCIVYILLTLVLVCEGKKE